MFTKQHAEENKELEAVILEQLREHQGDWRRVVAWLVAERGIDGRRARNRVHHILRQHFRWSDTDGGWVLRKR
jgi:hypothetical protein